MPSALNITGVRFGRLVAKARKMVVRKNGLMATNWLCLCDCGKTTSVRLANLRNGHTTSCGHKDVVPVEDRFWDKVKKGADCWEWMAARTAAGYGLINVGSKKLVYAHRISWTLTHGDPSELLVLHRCDNPSCVNPDHLFLGSHKDNMQDMAAKGRWGNHTRRFHVPA